MSNQVRRVITGFDENGESVVISDQTVEPVEVAAAYGSQFYLVWGTEGAAAVGGAGQGQTSLPFFPPLGGTRFVLLRYGPDSAVPEYVGDPDKVFDEATRKLPGVFDPFESDSLGKHTTDSIDYAFCIDGEMWLELDNGQEVRLTPGTCLVQRGTRHSWHNRSSEPSLMLYVLIGATRES